MASGDEIRKAMQAAGKLPTDTCTINGVEFLLVGRTAREQQEFEATHDENDENLRAEIIIDHVADGAGVLVFNQDDVDWIMDLPTAVTDPIVQKCLNLARGVVDVGEAAKN